MAKTFFSDLPALLEKFSSFLNMDKFPEWEVSDIKTLDDIWENNDYLPGSEDGRWTIGLYFILNRDKEVLYVGKASNNNSIGHRLGTYFVKNEQGPPLWRLTSVGEKFKAGGNIPYSLAVIAFEDYNTAWIVPAMEEFFIAEISPPANVIGKKKHG